MIAQFNQLTTEEAELLLKAPALVSVLAASGDNMINDKAKTDAIKLSHLKTFTADPILQPYYQAVEKNFEANFDALVKIYAPFNDAKHKALIHELNNVSMVISKLDKTYAAALLRSLAGYAEHVKKAERVLLENFIFPFKIPGLTD